VTELGIGAESPFIGRTCEAVTATLSATIMFVVHDGIMQPAASYGAPLAAGDILLLRGGVDELLAMQEDQRLESLHDAIGREYEKSPEFGVSSLDSTGYASEFFDCVFCVSVMEHTDNYGAIVEEFSRILRPGGRLIITFDISIDGTGDIAPSRADRLVSEIEKRFELVRPMTCDFHRLDETNQVTTRGVRTMTANRARRGGEPAIDAGSRVLLGRNIGRSRRRLEEYGAFSMCISAI